MLQTFINIIHQDLSFGGIALKTEYVVFVYKLIKYEIMFLLLGYVTNTSDPQPSTAISNLSSCKSIFKVTSAFLASSQYMATHSYITV